ncbi:hypothetical protein LZC95_49410 [Pendulispora brunnea]|uniref:Uncharacterized protein n=1 Tax=Pendulispora brunnea TaxID=2905690 RepID=A0ABZ2K707_9BACT
MNSIRLASMVASFAFGLVGYASQAFAETPASFDPSSTYQPSPNSRPLAVQPPVSVTGVVGSNLRTAPVKSSAVASYDPSSTYQPSPNSRPLAVQPPVAVTGAVGSPVRVAPVQAAQVAKSVPVVSTVLTAPAMPAPARIEAAQPAMALNYGSVSTAYNPSPNYKPVFVSPNVIAAQKAQRTAALRVSASEGQPGISPNVR